MAKARRGRGPSSPEEVAEARRLREARARAAARAAERNPASWGVEPGQLALQAANDAAAEPDAALRGFGILKDKGGRARQALRSDVFDLLHARGGLSGEEHRAARRLHRDVEIRARAGPRLAQARSLEAGEGAGGGGGGAPDPVDRAIDAADRVDEVLAAVGRADAALLLALAEALASGAIRPWRAVVLLVTGERDADRQPARVQGACANLRAAYDWLDREPAELRRERRILDRALRAARRGVVPDEAA